MDDVICIREASIYETEKLLEIYAYYVEKTAISFETKVPCYEEFKGRVEKTLQNYPYFVAVEDGEILGYAYLSPFVGRSAYDLSAETTIYLKHGNSNKGIGKALYSKIEEVAKKQNIANLYSCIGYTDKEDEYLTNNSANFHEHMGYKLIGKFSNCGHKFGRWYHMVWMEKIIGEHKEIKEFFKYSDIKSF